MKKTVRLAALLLALTLALPCAALAGELEDQVSCTWVVTGGGANFSHDEIDGVKAYPLRPCSELVTRYYSEVYGVDMWVGTKPPYLDPRGVYYDELTALGGFFRVTDAPRRGDIVHWPAEKRGKSYPHSALVKSYENGVITLIEQNFNSGGKTAFERKVRFPSNYYDVYRLPDFSNTPSVAASEPEASTPTDAPVTPTKPEAPVSPEIPAATVEPEAPFVPAVPEETAAPSAATAAVEVAVQVTPQAVLLDGAQVFPAAYIIGGSNYFLLRDIAGLLSGTSAAFSVDYDGAARAVIITSGEDYDGPPDAVDRTPASAGTLTSPTVYIDGAAAALSSCLINGNNYFKLRDLAAALDFGVTYDAENRAVVIDSTTGYTPE